MPDEELEELSEEESALMQKYQDEGELPPGEAEGEIEPEVQAVQAEPEPQPEAIRVPLHELKEERQKRQEAERQLNLLMERTNTLLGQIQQVTAPGPEMPPDKDEDPVGYLQWQNDRLLEQLNYQTQTQQQTTQQQAQERAAQAFWNDYNQGIVQFAEKTPDYKEAVEFMVDSRRRELDTLGINDPGQQDQILWQESFQIAAMARERGQNHAEIFYNLAKQRGFQPGSAPAGTAQPAPVATQTQQPKQNLDNVRRGSQAATSLSNVGGSTEVELTAEALINMSDDEFTAATTGKKWRQLHGR